MAHLQMAHQNRFLAHRLAWVAKLALVVLLTKVLASILNEYRWYFPPDFDESAFLSGRRYAFVGIYRAAFYVHILCGPATIALGAFLVLSGGRTRFRQFHRWAGRSLLVLVLALLTPSGVVMALDAYAGPLAAAGFAGLSVVTAVAVTMSAREARWRRFGNHRRWATRSFLLLISPLLLRLVSGTVIVLDVESDWIYRANAWLSWLVPLVLYECWWRFDKHSQNRFGVPGKARQ